MIFLNIKKRNEISYYPEITTFIESQLKSNFRAQNKNDIHIFWKIGEFTSKLDELIKENPCICECIIPFWKKTPPLNLDIFGVVTDGNKFEIIILEVKLRSNVGLSEWSQLLGYSVVSDAKYGLLVNIDAGASKRLVDILARETDASKITRVKNNGETINQLMGFMQWNSKTHNFEYSNLGQLWSISALSDALLENFL
jgi:hypothetical protein